MALDADRRAALAGAKLQALVRSAFPDVEAEAQPFNAGVGLVQEDRAFVYVIERAPSPMAAVLAWGERAGARELHLIVDDADAVLAAQALGLSPSPSLWQVVDTSLRAIDAAELPAATPVPDTALALEPVLEDAGCSVVIEHGVVLGEIEGLEVARVVVDADGAASIRVGVGMFDQEAHAVIHADTPVEARLSQVVAQVAAQRRPGAGPHPLNLAARERWLRSQLVRQPSTIDVTELRPIAPLAPRQGIREERPAAALGARGDRTVLVVCATGIDLDVVPEAAGQLSITRADEVVLAVPARDAHPIIERMAARLAAPASVHGLGAPWDPR